MKPLAVAPRASRQSLALVRRRGSAGDDVSTKRIEDVGLFLRDVLSAAPPADADVAQAIERLARDGVELKPWVVEHLVETEHVVRRCIESYSAQQLCVLLDALSTARIVRLAPPKTATATDAATADVALSEPTPSSCFAPLHDRLVSSLREAISAGREELQLAFHGDAESLRPAVISALVAKHHAHKAAKRLGDALRSATNWLSMLPMIFVHELQEMATSGRCVSLEASRELSTPSSKATLASALQHLTDAQVRALMLALSRAATTSLAPDVLALWGAAHAAALASGKSNAFGVGARPALDRAREIEAAPEIQEVHLDANGIVDDATSVQEDTQQLALAIQRLAQSSSLAAVAFSQRTVDSLAAAAQNGDELTKDALDELATHWDHVLLAMPLEQVDRAAAQLRRLADEARSHHAAEWRALLDKTQRTATDATRSAELPGAQATDFYTSSRLAAHRVVRVLDEKLSEKQREAARVGDKWARQSQRVMKEAYDAAARGAVRKHDKAATLLGRLRSKLPSLSKLEIMRDFAQTISLVFTNLYTVALEKAPEKVSGLQRMLDKFQIVYRNLFNFVAADFTAAFLRFSGMNLENVPDYFFAAFLLAIAVACGCFAWLLVSALRRSDLDVGELSKDEAVADRQRSKRERKIRTITILLTICQTVHLPVARLAMEVLTGSPQTSSVHKRYRAERYWHALWVGSIVLLVVYVGGLVAFLFYLIQRHAPSVVVRPLHATSSLRDSLRQRWRRLSKSKHLEIVNLDGTRVDFRNSVYAEILRRDPVQLLCPYRSLYASFERRWRYYKVVQLAIKVVLTMLLIPIRDERLRALLTWGVTSLSVLATFTAPFIDDFDDWMECCAKLTAWLTCGGGAFLAYDPMGHSGWARAVSMAVTIANLANALLMLSITCLGSDTVRLHVKRWLGKLTFSDSRLYAVDKPAAKVLPSWDVEHELRHRVWHDFWQKLLLSLGDEAAIQRLAHAKVEEEEAAEVAAKQGRAVVLKRAEVEALVHRRHWVGQADECVAAVRALVRSLLEGPDVYCEPRESHTSRAGFGRLNVVPYPFRCEFQPDGGESSGVVAIAEDRDVAALLFANFRGDVVERRLLRQKLRALSAWGGPVELLLARDEPWEPSEGKSLTARCQYTSGVVQVQDDGFRLAIQLHDGYGEVVDPATSEVVACVANHSATVEGDDAMALLGLSATYEPSDKLLQIFGQRSVETALAQYLPRVVAAQRDARELHIERQEARDAVLSGGFRFVVYNNPYISRRDLERYLAHEETNLRLQTIAVARKAALDVLYERLHYVYSDPRVGFWYGFWHDVFEENTGDGDVLHGQRHYFDPESSAAVGYSVMARDELQHWLERRGLWGERTLLGVRYRKRLFHSQLLDLLYESMEKQAASKSGNRTGP